MATRHSNKSRPAKSRAAQDPMPPGQRSRARDNAARGNPDAPASRRRGTAAGGNGKTAAAARPAQSRKKSTPPPLVPAEELGLLGRATDTLRIAGIRAAKGTRAVGSKAADGLRTARSVAAETVDQHPTAVSALGAALAAAGVALIAARAMSARSGGPPDLFARAGDALDSLQERAGDAADSLRDGATRLGEYGRDGLSRAGATLRTGAAAVGSGAEEGYEYVTDKIATVWDEYPLATGAGLLAIGVIAGMMLPTTRIEQSLVGRTARDTTRRATAAARELARQGRQVAEKVMTGASEAVREMADFEALAPDRLARKAKRLATRLKNTVTDAVRD